MKTERFEKSRELPPGVWNDEPDKAQWVDQDTNLDCLIVRNDLGALCGYVGVSEGHKFFGKEYNNLDLNCHGGLTYSDFCQDNGKICHIAEPGRPEKVWWFGFDCAHSHDHVPGLLKHGFNHPLGNYRDFEYVKKECEKLAKQLFEIE